MTATTPPVDTQPPRIPENQSRRERSIIYIVLAVVFAILLVVALLVHRSRENDAEAHQKATQLVSALNSSGRHTRFTPDQIAGVLGTDGGATCADPAGALGKSALFSALTNGAGGPGTRPIIADSRLVQGQVLIVQVYCPDKLTEFRDMVHELKFDTTVKP